MPNALDVLIPTFERPAALAVTLAGLSAQTLRDFRVVISDQSEFSAAEHCGEVEALARVLRAQGRPVEMHRRLPRRGMAEQRHFLLSHARAPRALFLDDDLLLEIGVLDRMRAALDAEGCGFVGCPPVGLSYRDEARPHEQVFEPWEGPVRPERVVPEGPGWDRHRLHNAANPWHVQQRGLSDLERGETPNRYVPYHIAWVGGCVLYDTEKLRSCGGFDFWRELPAEHAGEDVLAQLRVMARHGGCGILPAGVYHLELPTTVRQRRVDAPRVLPVP